MSKLNVDNIENRLGTGGPQLPGATFTDDIVGTAASFTGIVTATSFDGNLTGNADTATTATTATNAQGLTGNPSISVTDITAAGNVSIAGTLTYEDVSNVDSIGIITAQSGIDVTSGNINVGTATTITDGGINVIGVVTATSFSGDGSQLQGVESGVRDFIASGSISNGDVVVINTDGTVSVATTSGPEIITAGTPVVYDSSTLNVPAAVYDSSNNKVVIAYEDSENSNRGTAVVGTVTGTAVTFGTPVVFDTGGGASYVTATYDSTNSKVVIAYRDGGNSNFGTAIVGTVSGDTISFGGESVFDGNSPYISATYDSANQKVVIAYQDSGNLSYGTAVVGTVSGTSITFGTPVVFDETFMQNLSVTYDSTNDRVVIAYTDVGNSSYGTAVVGTVTGTAVTFGTPAVFESATTWWHSATYDSTNSKVAIIYRDDGNSSYGTAIAGTVSGDTISFGTPVVFDETFMQNLSVTYDSTNDRVVAAADAGSSGGRATVINTSDFATNLTTENYIGIAAEAISDTATGKITIAGGVNSGQTGLITARTYYVQGVNGGIGTVTSTPSVVAGTSISSTEIIVKG